MKDNHSALYKIGLPFLSGFVMIALWYAIKQMANIHDFLLPAPHDILIAFYSERNTLWKAAGVTFLGSFFGFLAAIVLGFALSLILASVRSLRSALYPYVIFLQMSPLIATAAIVVILFDVGLQSVVLIAFLICFFPVVASTLQGLRSVPERQLEMFRLYKATPSRELFLLRVPYALPWFFNGAKIAATLAVIGSVTGEIFAGSSDGSGGLGFMIMIYKSQLKIPAIYAATFICCAMGFLFVASVILVRNRVLKTWHESAFVDKY